VLIPDHLTLEVEPLCLRPGMEFDARVIRVFPDRVDLLAFPECLGQRRPGVRRVFLCPDDADGA
jgi:hypothetical protein